MDFFGKKAKSENEQLKQLIESAGGGELLNLDGAIQSKQQAVTVLEQAINSNNYQLSNLQKQVQLLQSQLISFNEQLELESFSLYTPRYAFRHSSEYKTQLDYIRNSQKEMIRSKSATYIPKDWTVNGSKAEGRKMVNGMAKLLLRSFNNECESCVLAVKFSNVDVCENRIRKSFEAINTLAKTMSVSIAHQYLNLKLKELYLAHEYAEKKQAEKEDERELREQLREEKKLVKEIEEARKLIAKEQKHYQNALSQIEERLASCQDESERMLLLNKKQETLDQLDVIDQNLKAVDYRESNKRAGYVYIVSNLGAFGNNVYKIGMTRRLEPLERVTELSGASVPFVFDVHAMIFSDDAPTLETALHNAFANRKINKINQRKEFFNVTLDEIENVIKKHHDKIVDIVKEHDAEQFRESRKILQVQATSVTPILSQQRPPS